MTVLPQVKPVSIRQTVGETIRRALLEGGSRRGQALSEVALASEMNVSRGPVREALLVLAERDWSPIHRITDFPCSTTVSTIGWKFSRFGCRWKRALELAKSTSPKPLSRIAPDVPIEW